MIKTYGKRAITVLMILFGLFLISNIIVLGNREAAIEMHEDLPPDASAFVANGKVIDCFVVGILFVLSGIGILRKKKQLVIQGAIGAFIFIILYIIQITLWSDNHPRMIFDFSVFGSLVFGFGLFAFIQWRFLKKIEL